MIETSVGIITCVDFYWRLRTWCQLCHNVRSRESNRMFSLNCISITKKYIQMIVNINFYCIAKLTVFNLTFSCWNPFSIFAFWMMSLSFIFHVCSFMFHHSPSLHLPQHQLTPVSPTCHTYILRQCNRCFLPLLLPLILLILELRLDTLK